MNSKFPVPEMIEKCGMHENPFVKHLFFRTGSTFKAEIFIVRCLVEGVTSLNTIGKLERLSQSLKLESDNDVLGWKP